MFKDSSSFRDPSGYVFEHQNCIYRTVSKSYESHYQLFQQSGLMEKLFQSGLLVKHEVANLPDFNDPNTAFVLKPERLELITYPHEWSFGQLKEAALLTLEILRISLEHGMILKDASGYNVQYEGYKPIFIDTLSFETYEEGQAWSGYKQFCEHFLAPLCLSSYLGIEFQSLIRLGVEGIPLKMTSKILPWRTWLKPGVLFHIHLHAKSVDFHASNSKGRSSSKRKIPKKNLLAMTEHLTSIINSLQLKKSDRTQWEDYDKQTHYSEAGRKSKVAIINDFANQVNPRVIWDMGANDGFFSRSLVTSDSDRVILSLDADSLAVEKNFQSAKSSASKNVYSLLMDITNPSADIGWANQERKRLALRSKPDLIMALAVVHHLAITYNIPFSEIANYFSGLSDWLIIEYVPFDDEKIAPLPETAGKKMYNRENFNRAFFATFTLIEERKISDSGRTILLLKKL